MLCVRSIQSQIKIRDKDKIAKETTKEATIILMYGASGARLGCITYTMNFEDFGYNI